MEISQLLPLTGPSKLFIYAWFALALLFLPAVGALLPIIAYRPTHLKKAATIVSSVAVAAPVLWYELFDGSVSNQEVIWLAAIVLGTYVSGAISLLFLGRERDDARLSVAGGVFAMLLVIGIVVV